MRVLFYVEEKIWIMKRYSSEADAWRCSVKKHFLKKLAKFTKKQFIKKERHANCLFLSVPEVFYLPSKNIIFSLF